MLGAGLAAAGVGMLLMGGVSVDSEWTTLLGGFILGGAGVGLINPVIADAAVSVVPSNQSGMAAGINDTFRQLGVAVGIAAWGAVFIGRGSSEIATLTAGTPAASGDAPRELIEATSSGILDQALSAIPAGAQEAVAGAAREGFIAGLNEILVLGALLAFAAAIAAVWLVREDQIERGEIPTAEPAIDGDAAPAAAVG
jgi:hypothetical protein